MAQWSCAAKTAASWTGRMVDGDWFRFPLDGAPGRVASGAGHEGILAEVAGDGRSGRRGPSRARDVAGCAIRVVGYFGRELMTASGWLAILESGQPGSYLPHVLAVAAGTYRVLTRSSMSGNTQERACVWRLWLEVDGKTPPGVTSVRM